MGDKQKEEKLAKESQHCSRQIGNQTVHGIGGRKGVDEFLPIILRAPASQIVSIALVRPS